MSELQAWLVAGGVVLLVLAVTISTCNAIHDYFFGDDDEEGP